MRNIETLIQCINTANNKGLLANNNVLTGYSGEKLIGTLQRFAETLDQENEIYLEIGVFQGLSLLSVAQVLNNGEAYGIDNFSQFDKDNKNLSIVKERASLLKLSNYNIINNDFEDALINLRNSIHAKKVGLYFIDGPHDYRSQLMCLLLAKPFLADNAIIIIDDSNYEHVRQANKDFLISNPEFKLLFEAYSSTHPHNLSEEKQKKAKSEWWNGVNVIIKDTNNRLKSFFPPTKENKQLYYNQHLCDSGKFPTEIPHALSLMNALVPFRPFKVLNRLIKLRSNIKTSSKDFKGDFDRRNTFSKELTKFNLIKPQ